MSSSGQAHLQIRKPEMRQVPNVNRRLDDQEAQGAKIYLTDEMQNISKTSNGNFVKLLISAANGGQRSVLRHSLRPDCLIKGWIETWAVAAANSGNAGASAI
jgi:hypothetical protein